MHWIGAFALEHRLQGTRPTVVHLDHVNSNTPTPAQRRPLSLVLVLAGVCCAAVVTLVFGFFDGWQYYSTPVAGRGYLPAHRLLRPSGVIGLTLGVMGTVAMVSTLPYAARKRWRPLARFGRTARWLEVHIFFGIVGPVLVTLHTAFKFNGAVAIGYWLMMAVWASGFVGRYLYVRIPRTIRGVELSRKELLAEFDGPMKTAKGVELAALTRRLAHLERIRRLFSLWHHFHRPLVWAMFIIVSLHVSLAVYLGYVGLFQGPPQ